MMEFELLGAVELRSAGGPCPVGSPKQGALLAALLVDVNHPVPVDTLIDRVWGANPPDRARRNLHTYVARLRRIFIEAADDHPVRLLRRPGGYLVEVEPERVDWHRFLLLLQQARRVGCPDPERARLLGQAVALWRGEPLAGVAGDWAERVRHQWRTWRVDAAVAWARAEILAGAPATVIATLTELHSEDPLVESLAAALMATLHATGRSAEALQLYAATRRRLVEELGADPGAELQAVHHEVLRGGRHGSRHAAPSQAVPAAAVPTVAAAAGAAAGPTAAAVAAPADPAQLPGRLSVFVGRAAQLARLDQLLRDGESAHPPPAISVISGAAGIGKTALAVRWAHKVAARFPDGQLYVNLGGFDCGGIAMRPRDALRDFLQALGVPADRVPSTLDGRTALYRSLLAGRRILVLLDNARDAEQVRPLLPGASGCLTVITSRNRLSGLVAGEGARSMVLDLLPHGEAWQLLVSRLGRDRVAADPGAAEEIIGRCARLPLSLAVIAARAATHPDLPLDALAGELRAARGLDAFDDGDAATDVRSVFSWSYRALDADVAGLFRLLPLHPGRSMALPAVASLAGVSPPRARVLLAGLSREHLVSEVAPGRYAFHDLLRAYASELGQEVDSAPERRMALHRLLDHYLHTAHLAARLLQPHRDFAALPDLQPGVRPAHLLDGAAALQWFAVEASCLVSALRAAAAAGLDRHVSHLATALNTYVPLPKRWQEQFDGTAAMPPPDRSPFVEDLGHPDVEQPRGNRFLVPTPGRPRTSWEPSSIGATPAA